MGEIMSRGTRLLASIAAAAAVFAGTAGASTPAQASTAGLFAANDSWYQGFSGTITETWSNLGYDSDKYSSVRNEDSVAWVLFDDKYFRDRRFCIRPGESVPDLGAPLWKFNDKTSSVLRLSTASCEGYPAFYTVS